jgi:hypothetical protein
MTRRSPTSCIFMVTIVTRSCHRLPAECREGSGLWFAKNPVQVFEPLIRGLGLNGNRTPLEVTAALALHGEERSTR